MTDPPSSTLVPLWMGWDQDKDDKKAKKAAARSAPAQLVNDFKKTLKASRKLRSSLDMTKYQLTEMHDR